MTPVKVRVVLSLAALLCALGVVGCSSEYRPALAASGLSTDALPIGDPSAPIPAPGTCKLGNRDGQPMPDLKCTPGAINPAVRQDNIASTICQPGWTKTVRPPTSVTNRIKTQIDQAYGLPTNTEGELDHDVSLELGGAPDDPRNLWVEPGPIPNPKDAVENKLHAAVCSGLVPLVNAQEAIAKS